jgi:Ca2+-binding RTX toxin-like protein
MSGGTPGGAKRRLAAAFGAASLAVVPALALTGTASGGGGLSCLGSPVTIGNGFDQTNLIGTERDDVIHGTNRTDFIDGRGGNDKICTFDGHNVAIGGAGNDRFQGGPAGEILVGDEYSTSGPAAGTGDDDVTGGGGTDIVVGDAYSTAGPAQGSGNDEVHGHDGADVVVGDAYSDFGAVGTGNDRMTGGEGNDVEIGDALVGIYNDPVSSPAAGAAGGGDDEINGYPDTDLVIGDAAVFGPGNADCAAAGSDKLNGETNAKDGDDVSGFGKTVELLVGDCYSTGGSALGAAGDRPIINGGDGNDVLVGDSYAPNGAATGTASEPNMLGGGGDDKIFSDHHPGSASTEGGGDDHPRGGKGDDTLEGGPASDLCSGGPGKDKFTKKGTNACEDTTGDP